MALKIRVHELATELGIGNKDIIAYLNEKGITGKTAVSLVPEAEVYRLRELHAPKPEVKPEENAPEPSSAEAPKKRKIVRVIRKQNAEGTLPKKENADAPAETKTPEKKVIIRRVVKVRQTEDKNADGEAGKTAAAAPAVKEESAVQAPPAAAKETEPVKEAVPAPEADRAASPAAQAEGTGTKEQPAPAAQDQPAKQEAPKTEKPVKPEKPAAETKPPLRTEPKRPGVKILRTREQREADMARMARENAKKAPRTAPQERGGAQQGGPGRRDRDRDRGAKTGQKNVFVVRNQIAPPEAGTARRKGRGDRPYTNRNEQRGAFEDGPRGKGKGKNLPKALQPVNRGKNEQEAKKEVVTEITIPERITVRELSEKMKVNATDIIKKYFMKGEMLRITQELPFEKAQEIALEYDIIAEQEEKEDVIGNLLAEEEEDEKNLVTRPPVVCVMGHVDHGKTSLLDAIRDTHVIDREAGGITQHIGAYMVTCRGQKITFLDTPGHEAFTAMRMRGANSTDIAVLVVAADDGVMPQTIEAINHAKAAGVEIIVAINKIDKPEANPERVKQELTEYGLIPEDWGGTTIFCEVSAKTHEGIDQLLEMILLAAEVKELKANPNRNARGLVLEAKLDKGRGPVATILIQKGTLRQGDFIACGAMSGKVRAMTDDKGRPVRKALPSMPVEIIGLSGVPNAGEVLVAVDSDKEAKNFAATFVTEGRKNLLEGTQTQMSLDDLFNRIKEDDLKELPIVVKADVQGSAEAVSQSLERLTNEEIVVKVIHSAVGAINESDVSLAAASGAIIVGFNVKPDATAKSVAEQNKVEIQLYNVIYQAIDDIEKAIKGMRASVFEEQVTGHAVIRQIFKASGIGNIAGSYVTDGIFERDSLVRIMHGGNVVHTGKLASLKRFKDDVKEVREGFECGLVFDGFQDFEVDDTVEAYKMVEVRP